MELLALDYPVTRPRGLVDRWTSLIWTERFQRPGEFKLTTSQVEYTRNQIPIGSMVGINESEEVMRVDTHEIGIDDNGKPELVVSGESFPAGFMRYRIALDNYPYYNENEYNEAGEVTGTHVHTWRLQDGNWNDTDAAMHMMLQHLIIGVFNSEQGTIRPEVLPNLTLVQTDTGNRRPYLRYIPRTDLLTAVQELLVAAGSGMRSRRAIGSAVNTELILYQGVVRNRAQISVPPVVLHHHQGHLMNQRYLFSDKQYYNSFRIFPTNKLYHQNWVWQGENLIDADRMGIFYRDKLVDASEISSQDQLEVVQAIQTRQATEIAMNAQTAIMECTVAENIPYVFGTHYNMGDVLTLVGDFGIVRDARVIEYVRTEDKNGVRASPGLDIFQVRG